MEGSRIDDDWDLTEPFNEVLTMVLVGRAGNGKSATGNSILGKKAFKSGVSSTGITSTCQMQRTVLGDGQVVNVIDTPGLCDFSMGADLVGKEIINRIRLAKDGIHAVIVVFSVRTRFTQEEETVIQSLQTLFGEKIVDYMIILFTGGDDLEEDDVTLEEYLGRECPASIKKILQLCKNRMVLFDNKTKDATKKAEQVQELLRLVNLVRAENHGQPFSDEFVTDRGQPFLDEFVTDRGQPFSDEFVTDRRQPFLDEFVTDCGQPSSDEFVTELKEGPEKLLDKEKLVDSLKGFSEQEISKSQENISKSYETMLKRIIESLPILVFYVIVVISELVY